VLTALQLGKLASRGRLKAVALSPLIPIEDQLSRRRFLVDTGASFSIYPFSSKAAPTGPTFFGPAGKLIPCWGEKSISLQLYNRKFTWTFLLAAVSFPIIGVDFLRHFKLLIDPAANRLVDTTSCQAFSTMSSLAMPAVTAVAAAAAALPPQSPVISHSHRSSAAVTGHQPQSPVEPAQLSPLPLIHMVASILPYAQLLADYRWLTSPRFCLLLLQRSITSPQLGRRYLQNFGGWTASNWRRPRRSFSRWKRTALWGGQTAPGHGKYIL
jgi:hypothetical protein